MLEPFHFDQIHRTIEFHYAIDLLDDAFVIPSPQSKSFSDKNPGNLKELIQNPFQCFPSLLSVSLTEQSEKGTTNLLELQTSPI